MKKRHWLPSGLILLLTASEELLVAASPSAPLSDGQIVRLVDE